jgi:hypothetical protein
MLYGTCGYEKNPEAAVAFNEALIEQGNEEAINRKLEGVLLGVHGYDKNLEAINPFVNTLL